MPKKKTTKTKNGLTPKWKRSPESNDQYVNSVAISSDGNTVVAGSYFFQYGAGAKHNPADAKLLTVGTFAWNANGKTLWKDVFQATEGVYWVAISRDGQWAASCGRLGPAEGFVYIYNVASGRRVFSYSTKVRVNMVAFSQDGSYLVAGADNTYLFSRSGSSWGQPQKLAPVTAHDSVIAVSISGDGKWIGNGTFHGTVNLIENNNGSVGAVGSWQMPSGAIRWVAVSFDGSALAVAASDSNLRYFSTAGFGSSISPAWTAPMTGCKDVRSVSVSDDGSIVSAVGNATGGGKLFLFASQGTSGKALWSQPTVHSPNSTSIDSRAKFVTAADGYPDGKPGDFYLFKADGTKVGRYKTANMSWPMQISSDGSGIAAGSDDSYIYYFAVK
jgi:WD40 repeat protein